MNKIRFHTWSSRGILLGLFSITLVACDSVPTESKPDLGTTNRVLSYSGPSCGAEYRETDPDTAEDACTFKVEFWNKMNLSPEVQCDNCHDSQSGSSQSPFFLESSNIDQAYTQALSVVDLTDPGSSRIVERIAVDNHYCGDAGACAALATIVEGYITNWANGGSIGSGGETNEIVLTPPRIWPTGSSRSYPATGSTTGDNGSSFANTIWPIVNENCSGCHTESSTIPQAPFFAEDNIEAAYEALVTSQKINLDDPAVSRLVVRLDPEFHNCWDPNNTGGADCAASATVMLNAITRFRNGITPSEVNPNWVVSHAMNLTEGILASGGARDDSSTIALYEMKTGSGSTLFDTSGVEPVLNLSLSGTADIDYRWVGGWGIEFISGRAQGSAQNTKLRDHLVSSGEYSIEAWIVPADVNQGTAGDPARIISYSGSDTSRNFTLGQAEYRYEYMNRTEDAGQGFTVAEIANGQPSFITDDADEDLQASQQHVVATYDPVNGRRIYVNGLDVSGIDVNGVDNPDDNSGEVDAVTPGSLLDWDDSFAFILGSEAGGSKQWEGKLRLVAIHNRAMTPDQVMQNFEAGVGEKFFLLFSVSDLMDNPAAGDSNCFQSSAITARNPRGDQCFIYMLVSQFDSHSYLFSAPTFISLNPAFTPGGTVIKGMRIGVNGKEPVVGQAFVNLGRSPTLSIDANPAPNGYCAGIDPVTNRPLCGNTAYGEQVLSDIGTIIALEKGAGADEFFLSFEEFGTYNDGDVHVNAEYVCDVTDIATCLTPITGSTQVSDIGLRVFNEINATMAAITRVDPNTANVKTTYDTIEQQMPPVETIEGFVSANQMAIAQLAIQYCNELVEDNILRNDFFGTAPTFAFTSDVNTAFDIGGANETDRKNQIVDSFYNKIVAHRASGSTDTLADMPDLTDVKAELIGPDPAVPGHPGNLFDRMSNTMAQICSSSDPLINVNCDNSEVRTRAVVKAMCTSVLGSASMLLQ